MHITYTLFLLLASGFSQAQQQPCIPTPNSADDVPAIRAALEECGDGGTIIFPSSQTYHIGSTLNLALCHGCKIQIDGTLNISVVDPSPYDDPSDVFQLAGASNITISGNGLINGGLDSPFTMFNISSASNIRISGLTIRSPQSSIFLVRDSQGIYASNLSLATNLDPNSPVKYSSWINGFDVVSNPAYVHRFWDMY
jgi:hypothetical protein